MSKHTPGPWEVQLLDEQHSGYADWKTFNVRASNNCHLASVGHVDRFHSKDTEANAHLIAAAPELLEACTRAHDALLSLHVCNQDNSFANEIRTILKDAIAKATN